ncbi:radical SAM/SPASM protein FxsB, inactivated metallohydrolase extension form [Streptomyces sp. NPDC056500]|uniref:radical SAM/SPASM protein FxsBH, inactivated beta-hydroxylase extension form n=1 Tax=Streptomyces sp. NPDC056500 TaxID=3345840 RepID=UPI0036BDF5B8
MTGPLVPFREIVLKVHSRCDLACDHCYIYEHADQSWLTRPKAISDEAISWTALRLAEHVKSHALPSVSVILHGGEPLLAGPARLRHVCEELTRALDSLAELDLRIHTNGLQLSPRYLDLFDEFHVKVGISLDGDRTANDRHRRFADGRTSHPLVLRAVDLLREDRYRHLYLGLLCTVDVANDPVAVYDALAALDPPRIDFLLPHATWDAPPARPNGSPTAYADWLLTAFDHWDALGRRVPVRLFESVLSTLAGGPSLTESLGLAPTDLVVVETDGTLEQVDSLKSAYEGAAATGFDVFHHTFDEVAAHPGVKARQQELAGVSATCRRCPVVRSCGGGLYTHRYSERRGFDSPSVYCSDLEGLIRGIECRTADVLVPAALTDPGALLAEHRELTRTLLARLHGELDGRGGPAWDRAWQLTLGLDADGDVLDSVWSHPYTRTWLGDALHALLTGRPDAVARALQLPCYLASALVAAGVPTPVPVPYEDGLLHLPGLGVLRIGDDHESGIHERGTAEVEPTADGFTATVGGTSRRVRLAVADDHWQPVRTVGGTAGAPLLRLDDLDRYRDCFGSAALPRLSAAEVRDWDEAFADAWKIIRAVAPEQSAEAAQWLGTLTPLTSDTPSVPAVFGRSSTREHALRGHGYGALGLAPAPRPEQLAIELLRGARRAKLNALLDITDLYAQDGWWRHPAPWQDEEVPVSELLAGVSERAALAAFDPEGAKQAGRALDTLERAAELTVGGRRLLAQLRRELAHHSGLDHSGPGCSGTDLAGAGLVGADLAGPEHGGSAHGRPDRADPDRADPDLAGHGHSTRLAPPPGNASDPPGPRPAGRSPLPLVGAAGHPDRECCRQQEQGQVGHGQQERGQADHGQQERGRKDQSCCHG